MIQEQHIKLLDTTTICSESVAKTVTYGISYVLCLGWVLKDGGGVEIWEWKHSGCLKFQFKFCQHWAEPLCIILKVKDCLVLDKCSNFKAVLGIADMHLVIIISLKYRQLTALIKCMTYFFELLPISVYHE